MFVFAINEYLSERCTENPQRTNVGRYPYSSGVRFKVCCQYNMRNVFDVLLARF
jgi:hypothetical protein